MSAFKGLTACTTFFVRQSIFIQSLEELNLELCTSPYVSRYIGLQIPGSVINDDRSCKSDRTKFNASL